MTQDTRYNICSPYYEFSNGETTVTATGETGVMDFLRHEFADVDIARMCARFIWGRMDGDEYYGTKTMCAYLLGHGLGIEDIIKLILRELECNGEVHLTGIHVFVLKSEAVCSPALETL